MHTDKARLFRLRLQTDQPPSRTGVGVAEQLDDLLDRLALFVPHNLQRVHELRAEKKKCREAAGVAGPRCLTSMGRGSLARSMKPGPDGSPAAPQPGPAAGVVEWRNLPLLTSSKAIARSPLALALAKTMSSSVTSASARPGLVRTSFTNSLLVRPWCGGGAEVQRGWEGEGARHEEQGAGGDGVRWGMSRFGEAHARTPPSWERTRAPPSSPSPGAHLFTIARGSCGKHFPERLHQDGQGLGQSLRQRRCRELHGRAWQ